jgi:hypothetical protein
LSLLCFCCFECFMLKFYFIHCYVICLA